MDIPGFVENTVRVLEMYMSVPTDVMEACLRGETNLHESLCLRFESKARHERLEMVYGPESVAATRVAPESTPEDFRQDPFVFSVRALVGQRDLVVRYKDFTLPPGTERAVVEIFYEDSFEYWVFRERVEAVLKGKFIEAVAENDYLPYDTDMIVVNVIKSCAFHGIVLSVTGPVVPNAKEQAA